MKIDRPKLIAAAVVAVVVLGGAALWLWRAGAPPKAPLATQVAVQDPGACKPSTTVAVTPDDFTFGEANAPITLVEYASQTCSHCAAFHAETYPKLEESYIKTGLVRFVFREFQRNRVDLAASMLGRCLENNAFIPFTNSLLENQATWMEREDKDVVAGLREMAQRAGMTNAAFDACLQKQDEATRLAAVREKAMKDYCLEGTPTLLLNGTKLDGSGQTFEGLDGFLRAELKRLGKSAPPEISQAVGAAPQGEGAPVAPAGGSQ